MDYLPEGNTSLLIHSDDIDGSTDIVDSSSAGHTLTLGGDIQHKTDQFYFAISSIYGDGNDSIGVPANDALNMGTGAFTIGCWYRPGNKVSSYGRIIQLGTGWSTGNFNLCDRHNSAPTKFFVQAQPEPGYNLLESITTVTIGQWYYLEVGRDDAGNVYLFIDGILEDTAANKTFNVNNSSLTAWIYSSGSGDNVQGHGEEFFVIKGVCLHTANFTPPTEAYTLPGGPGEILQIGLTQKWVYPLNSGLDQPWGPAKDLKKALDLFWRQSRQLKSGQKQLWAAAPVLQTGLTEQWRMFGAIRSGLNQKWSVLQGAIQSGIVQQWSVKSTSPISAAINQFWDSTQSGAVLADLIFYVEIGGVSIQSVTSCQAGLNIAEAFNTATLTISSRAEFGAIALGHPVTIVQFGVEFKYFVSGRDSGWAVSGASDSGSKKYTEEFVIRCESETAALHRPHAADLNLEWPAGGSAEQIITDLAAVENITVDFQTDDFLVPTDFLTAENNTPWEVIQKVTGPLRLAEQTLPDGTLIIRESFPDRPGDWGGALPFYLLSADGGFSKYTEQFNDDQIIYNMVTVADSADDQTQDSLAMEVEDISSTQKRIRVWEVPWIGDFVLEHSGGALVSIIREGVMQEEKTDIVEIVDGTGTVSKPCYGVSSFSFFENNLTGISVKESGAVTTSKTGNTLVAIIYTTKYKEFIVNKGEYDKLQVYINGVQA